MRSFVEFLHAFFEIMPHQKLCHFFWTTRYMIIESKFWMCKTGHQHFYFHDLDALSKRLQWCFSLNSGSAKNNLGYLINKAANDSPIINSKTLSVTFELYMYRTWCYWLCNENVFSLFSYTPVYSCTCIMNVLLFAYL